MNVVWTKHAKERFFERSLKYGLTYDDAEAKIREQKIKEKQPNGTIKTIFNISENCFTAIKKDDTGVLNVKYFTDVNDSARLFKTALAQEGYNLLSSQFAQYEQNNDFAALH